MCQTTESSRAESPFMVFGDEKVNWSAEAVYEVQYDIARTDATQALRHFVTHHLKGREVACFSVDTTPRAHVYKHGGSKVECHSLIILTKSRPHKHNGDM